MLTAAIAVLLALFAAGSVAIAVLLYIAVREDRATNRCDLDDLPNTNRPDTTVIDQFGSEKGITR